MTERGEGTKQNEHSVGPARAAAETTVCKPRAERRSTRRADLLRLRSTLVAAIPAASILARPEAVCTRARKLWGLRAIMQRETAQEGNVFIDLQLGVGGYCFSVFIVIAFCPLISLTNYS